MMLDTPGSQSKNPRHLATTWISIDDWKKARRQEQCRVNNVNFRKRKRERELQSAAGGQESGQSTNSQVKDSKTTTEEEKKARRREKRRVYQFNYWKKKRLHEERLVTSIIELNKELQRLNTATASVTQQQKQKPNSMQSINAFYFALQENRHPPLAVVENYRSTYGCTPALEELLDLQREEFDSVKSLRLHWLWYRTQFKVFAFSIKACERLDTSRSTIIKITGTLRLGVYCDNQKRGSTSLQYAAAAAPSAARGVYARAKLLAAGQHAGPESAAACGGRGAPAVVQFASSCPGDIGFLRQGNPMRGSWTPSLQPHPAEQEDFDLSKSPALAAMSALRDARPLAGETLTTTQNNGPGHRSFSARNATPTRHYYASDESSTYAVSAELLERLSITSEEEGEDTEDREERYRLQGYDQQIPADQRRRNDRRGSYGSMSDGGDTGIFEFDQ
ncbi:hypothetical protein PHYBOEH_004272 [Phytophthora boehmeriae]|uniref:BZIP domain-containing protein n=1 Tax=Phytophthora boehmeriae TaxID=109152 RepID=A0A8T1WNT8_9STRA|nr:hypothetical protein PHYBOEH_004272 [Phytophthora boehmeriae]